jgi:glucose/arabinose dehydrogenase
MIEPRKTIDLPGWLGTLYAPFAPLLQKIRIKRVGSPHHNPADILLPRGYTAELVAGGLNAPAHCCFDGAGNCYVSECGHKIESRPRIVKIDLATGAQETIYEEPDHRWFRTGALTGALWHNGALYFANTDRLSRLLPGGMAEDIVTDLPGRGDHQANYPVLGPDGKFYFGVGTATNAGVVGADNFAYEWLPKYPEFHDVPAEDTTLAGRNFQYKNVLKNVLETVHSGAYVPFGTETVPGQVVKGSVKCSGSILRCNPDGTDLEVVAWGLRNPYGAAFDPHGRLFVTEHGMDDRGGRYIVGDPDDFYEIKRGEWYGWPDFASGIRLDDKHWGKDGQGRAPVLAVFPNPKPPKPLVSFKPHAAANGVSFSPSTEFGFKGDAFVALFGDIAPITTPRLSAPRGFKVVRIDMRKRRIVDFAVNKIAGPASQLGHGGFERPSHCAFGPDGALYVVDYGKIQIAPEVGGIRMVLGTGALWRIRPTGGRRGTQPPKPRRVPLYALQYGLAALLVGAGIIWALRRLGRGGR